MLLGTTTFRRKATANRQLIVCSVSAQPIFHALTPRHKKNEEIILVQLCGLRRCCLTVYVLWAIILTELR